MHGLHTLFYKSKEKKHTPITTCASNMFFTSWILICYFLSLGTAWNQLNTCYVRQSPCSDQNDKLDKIQGTLEDMASSLNRIEDVIRELVLTTTTPTTESTDHQTTEPTASVTPTTESETTAAPTSIPSEECGGPGWRRAAFINMTDPNQDCPQGLSLTGYSIRSCGRAHSTHSTCSSDITFDVVNEYSQVCGRVKAYRWGYNHAFYGYQVRQQTIEGYYVDGLSLTHGSPRTHIWSFASGLFSGTDASSGRSEQRCPCDPGNPHNQLPPFVGDDYFCDSVEPVNLWGTGTGFYFYPNNALWDGQNLLNECYGRNDPPWFYKTLLTPTSNDIQLRMCLVDADTGSNIAIEIIELYVY